METQSEIINEIATALSKAQGEFTPALKDTSNPFFKSKYANLCSIVKACQEPLSKHGISYSQSTVKLEGDWVLITKLMHTSGQWLSSITPIITMKPDIQSFGSACTYARRYGLASIAGVTTDEDDDGEGSMNRGGKPTSPKPKQAENVEKTIISKSEEKQIYNSLDRCEQEFKDNVNKFMSNTTITPKIYSQIMSKIDTHLKEKVA